MAIAENLWCCLSVLWELPELGIHARIMGLCGFAAAKLGVQKPLGPMLTSFCVFSWTILQTVLRKIHLYAL